MLEGNRHGDPVDFDSIHCNVHPVAQAGDPSIDRHPAGSDEVFGRELDYWEIRAGARNGNAPGPR